jgi:hypothetical protein
MENIFTRLCKLNGWIDGLNFHQKESFDLMLLENLYQFRLPTGVGKGYLMIIHLFHTILNEENNSLLAIASHRLSLNNQHLKEIIEKCIDLELIGKVKFLTIGSSSLNMSKVLKKDHVEGGDLTKRFNKSLYSFNKDKEITNRLTITDIFKSTLKIKEVNKIIKENKENGFITIVVSTYNSLDKLKDNELDVTYLDEAHTLASEKDDSNFKKSYEVINSKKKFFFTATPKDIEEQYIKDGVDSEIFLMNNKSIFGDIYEVRFSKCVEMGYITKPFLHIACPSDMIENFNYESIENKIKFIKDCFTSHQNHIKENSSNPNLIDAKMLVRCESVPAMWEIRNNLIDNIDDDIIVCAGASYINRKDRRSTKSDNHVIGDKWIKNRDEFIDEIQKIPDNQKVIILQYDIFSEGINVPGITGVMFLQKNLPTISKIIQIIGRSTRLHKICRDLIRKGLISTDDYSKWVKPYCAVIIPYWDDDTVITKRKISNILINLRDEWGFNPHFEVSIGDDRAKSNKSTTDDSLNEKNKRDEKFNIIDDINNDISDLDNMKLKNSELDYIKSKNDDEIFNIILKNS